MAVIFGVIFYYRHLAIAPTLPPQASSTTPAGATTSTPSQPSEPSSTASSTSPSQPAPTTGDSLDPVSGPVGTTITIHGSNFDHSNTIEMNGLVSGDMKNINSPDGHTLQFTVPSSLGPNCAPTQACPQFLMLVTDNIYKVSVVTDGQAQPIGTFTVTGSANRLPAQP